MDRFWELFIPPKTMVTRGMVYEFVLPTLFLQTLSYIVRNTGI